jgi:transcription elongation factor GreA
MNDTLITRDGLVRLTEELERLTTIDRRELAERLRHAGSNGVDPGEAVSLQDAPEALALVERRIAQLRERIERARLVEPDGSNGIVDLGERVRLRDLETGEQVEYELVGALDADPAAGRISISSPLGNALLGLRRGEVADYDAPKGRVRFEILAIDSPAGSAASGGRPEPARMNGRWALPSR